MLTPGMKGTCSCTVTADNTAKAFCSGALEVFATPAMIALMEECCWKMVQPELDEGMGTVGISLNVEHLAASPVGMEITCEATLTAIDGRKLSFEVEAFDKSGLIGKGSHDRFIVDNNKFQTKADAKL